jgi:hypothetical protein
MKDLMKDEMGAPDIVEGRRMLIAYYFMWQTGQPAAQQCEGCTWVTSQVRELSMMHIVCYLRQRGWPQRLKGKQVIRTDGRPTSQWSRLKAGYSDDLGTGRG